MAARQQGGQYRRQDTTVLVLTASAHDQPHPQWRWKRRVDGDWAKESVRAIWRVAEPVDYARSGSDGYARYHEPTDTVLMAQYGVLDTIIDLSTEPEHIQQSVREQAGAVGGDSE